MKTVNRTGRVEVEVHGIQNLPEKNGFILFPNHQGLFDVLAIMESCPNPLGIVVKKEASNIILIKQVIAAMPGMAIDRQDAKESLKVITKMTEDVKQEMCIRDRDSPFKIYWSNSGGRLLLHGPGADCTAICHQAGHDKEGENHPYGV